MSLQLYFNQLEIAKSQYSVDGFVKLWYDSFFLPSEMKEELQTLIMDYIVDVGRHYNIEISEDMTFKEFVDAYDELMYAKQCSGYPNQCLEYFAELGDWRNVRIAIKKGADDWNRGMYGAAMNNNLDLVEFFIEKGADDWNLGMIGAARGGYLHIVEFFIGKGADDWDRGMYEVARNTRLDLVEFFIEKRGEYLELGNDWSRSRWIFKTS